MIDQCLSLVIGKLINQISNNGELQSFRSTFETRKIYNNYEKNYIQNQKIKEELGTDYESQESDNQSDGIFGGINKYEMKCMLKENIIKQKFDSQKLSFIEPPSINVDSEQQNNQSMVQQESANINNSIYVSNGKELNPIDERKEVIANALTKKNLFALDFVIKQLENMIENKKNKKTIETKIQENLQNEEENQESSDYDSENQNY